MGKFGRVCSLQFFTLCHSLHNPSLIGCCVSRKQNIGFPLAAVCDVIKILASHWLLCVTYPSAGRYIDVLTDTTKRELLRGSMGYITYSMR